MYSQLPLQKSGVCPNKFFLCRIYLDTLYIQKWNNIKSNTVLQIAFFIQQDNISSTLSHLSSALTPVFCYNYLEIFFQIIIIFHFIFL